MPPPPAHTPMLLEELIEEIFLRLPPDMPACLVRASLSNKLWLGLLTGPAFRRRYNEFHGSPQMLGFLLSWIPKLNQEKHPAPHLVSTMKFSARIPKKCDWGDRGYDSLDCRHGRVLLADSYLGPRKLAVWDPMTGCGRDLDAPVEFFGLGGAVLCAVPGCSHRACHEGPFWVHLFGLSMNDGAQRFAHARLFSSKTDEWSVPCSALHLSSRHAVVMPRPSVLLKNALYSMILYPGKVEILKYDIGSNCMSQLDGPPLLGVVTTQSAILMTMEDDSLGFAYMDCLTLYLCSMLVPSDGVMTWTQRRVVDLKEFPPIQNPKKILTLIGYKEDSDIIFVTTDLGIYGVNLKSLEWKKLWKSAEIRALIPYMSFYNLSERVTTPSKTAHLQPKVDISLGWEANLINKKRHQLGGDNDVIMN